jgi:hypothetical protein
VYYKSLKEHFWGVGVMGEERLNVEVCEGWDVDDMGVKTGFRSLYAFGSLHFYLFRECWFQEWLSLEW